MNSISIIDKEYAQWVKDLSLRYRQAQIRAAVKVNGEMLLFYWQLGRDIVALQAESQWGSKVLKNLSADLKKEMPNAKCFSETNLLYMKNFYLLYSDNLAITPQVGEQMDTIIPQVGEQLGVDIFSVPWGHHKLLIDKYKNDREAALYYCRKTIEEGWSRDMLLNFVGSKLMEREGKAPSNFTTTLPATISDLAQEITRDPYCFDFSGITEPYNETLFKNALVNNITRFLLELGTGFAYVGKEHNLKIDTKDKYIDLLFYNLTLSCYVAVEVKIGEFDFPDMGQIQGYVVAVNHQLRKEGRDNPTIGILICRSKNATLARYALEGSNQPIAISEYDLQRLYPQKVEGIVPTIEEIETKAIEE